jgi:hypothetical protein
LRIHPLQHGIGGSSQAVPADKHGDLLVGHPPCFRLTAPPAGRARQTALLPLERFQKEGLVNFGNTAQTPRLLTVGQGQEAVAPAERGVAVDIAGLRAFPDAVAFRQLLGILQPLVFMPQACQGGARQGVEGLVAEPNSDTVATPRPSPSAPRGLVRSAGTGEYLPCDFLLRHSRAVDAPVRAGARPVVSFDAASASPVG